MRKKHKQKQKTRQRIATHRQRDEARRSHNSPENIGLQQRPLLPFLDDSDQVLSVAEWAMLNNISMRTARRILASPDAPVTVRLSTNRIGITRAANRAWQQSRERLAS